MRYLPIHLDTEGQTILIVGGGAAAEAKLRTLLKTDATLHLVSLEISPEISRETTPPNSISDSISAPTTGPKLRSTQ